MALAEAAVEVTVDTDKLERDARTKVGRAAQQAGQAFDNGFKRGVRDTGNDVGTQVTNDISGKLRASRSKFTTEGRRAGDNAGSGFSDGFRRALNFEVAQRALSAGFAPLRGIGQALGFSFIAAQAAAAAAALLQLATALAPAAGIIAVFPAGIALTVAAFASLSVALSGVGDAFSAALTGDAEAFDAAIKNLAPSAQALARELRTLAPAFRTLRTEVQQAFFEPLEGQITAVADVLMGPLKTGMTQVAAAFGQGASQIAAFLQQGQNIGFLASVFDSTRQSIEAFIPAIQPVLTGFRDIAQVGLSFFPGLSGSIASAAASFGTFLSEATASGQALGWIEGALALFRQLGGIVQSVGGVLSSVFQAASASGGDFLGSLGGILDIFNQFAASAAGQQALVSIFQALGQVGQTLGPIITTIVGALGGLAPIIAQIATALGPAVQVGLQGLSDGLTALGPSLIPVAEGLTTAFASIAEGMGPFGQALGDIIAALVPLLPPLGELIQVLRQGLTQAVVGLMPVIEPLVQILADNLATAIPILAPLLFDLVDALAELLVAFLPILIPALQIQAAFTKFLMIKGLTPLVGLLADAIRLLAGYVAFGAKIWVPFLTLIRNLPAAFMAAFTAVSNFVTAIPAFFIALPGKILSALMALPGLLIAFFALLWTTVLPALGTGVLLLLEFFVSLPGRIIGAVFTLIALFIGFLVTFWIFVGEAVVTGITAVIQFFSELPGKIIEAVKALPGMISEFFTSMWTTAKDVVTTGIDTIVGIVTSLPQRLSGLAGKFVSAGKKLITGLMDGLKNVTGLADDLGDAIYGAIKSGINKGIDSVNRGIDKINDKVPGSPIPRIPRFANGGIVDEATLGIFGEAGPEVIMPLSRGKRSKALNLAKESGVYQMVLRDHAASAQQAQQRPEVHNHFTIHSAAGSPEIMAQRIISRIAQSVGA